MSVPSLPLLLTGLIGADLAISGATWWGSELSGRDGLAPAIAVLLVASPIGFLVAHLVPLPVSRQLGRRGGITHLGSAVDRALPRLRTLVIDVEHVLTTGHLVVVDVAPLDVQHKHDLRWFAGALAHGSTDPVARAISRLAGPGRPTGVSQGPAHELWGAVDRHPVRFGLNGENAVIGEGVGTTVRVDVDQRPMGHITVADEVRNGAARCLSQLRDEGIEPVLVSATLNKPELMRVSEQVGVSQFHTGTDASTVAASLPHGTTGVVRAVGTDPAGETTLPSETGEDTVLRCADPSIEAAVESIRQARCLRRSRRVARTCAAAVIVVAVPLAASGLLTPVLAAIAAAAGLVLVAAVASLTVLLLSSSPVRE
jgi:cation transport ATPase